VEVAPDRWSATPGARGDRRLKTSEHIAMSIVSEIVSAGLRPGDRLPPESEMLQHYGVSRESMREGLRLLETQGLISIKRGPGGGPIVGYSDPRNLGRTCALHFHFAEATYEELLQAWEMAEPLLAELAARNADRNAVREVMGRWTTGAEPVAIEPAEFAAVSSGFHDDVAGLAANRVLSLVLPAFTCIVSDYIVSTFDTVVLHEEISHDHRMIAKAIMAGRPHAAQRLSAAHVHHITDFYRKQFPARLADLVEWR
jgi:GntR family transcriptional regulator, transcriptional repressor for pyruvate dehydrogenase complex